MSGRPGGPHPAETKPGERPFLVARLSLNRAVLLEATAGCVKCGSEGTLKPLSRVRILLKNRAT